MVAEPERIDSILARLTSRMGISARLEREKAVVLWEESVGASIARRTEAVSMRGGILFVVVENSMWLQELALMKESIIARLNALVGRPVVEDIIYRVGRPGAGTSEERGDGRQT